jgi:hypothetical protein
MASAIPWLTKIHVRNTAAERLAAVLLSVGGIGRPLVTPPQMPADRLTVLRDGYSKMIADPELSPKRENATGMSITRVARSSRRSPENR